MTTDDPKPTKPGASGQDEFQSFLAEYLARIERDGSDAIDEFRARHPEFASRLGHQLEWLAEHLGRHKGALPEHIGPYRVMQHLGSGGMGEVYLAEQMTPFRRVVAVKVIKVGKRDDARAQRFATEIQLLALLNHNGIAKVFEAGSDEGKPYFAMEYVPGKSITSYCAQQRLDVKQRLRLFLEVCRAVEHAHRHGILHRDLKPSNILVYGTPEQPVVKVIDFGLARMVEPEPGAVRQTQSGQFVGTPDYMSPEQVGASGERRVDTRADVYALGVVLYELLTGMLPLSLGELGVKDIQTLVKAIREREPSSPSVRVEESDVANETSPSVCAGMTPHKLSRLLAGDLDAIVMKALAKDADQRYGSVTQLADDIAKSLRHEPVSARAATRGYLLRQFLRRHRTGTAFAATLAAVAAVSVVMIWLYALESIHQFERTSLFGLAHYLDELREQDSQPLPPWPEHQVSRSDWMREFERIQAQRDRMVAFLATPPVTTDDKATDTAWAADSYADAMLRKAVRATLRTLDQMTRPGAEIDQMRQRMQWAERVRALTVEAYAAEWASVQRELRDDSRFASLELEPQVGLVPIGKGAQDLQEFALLLPGAKVPQRRADGKLVLEDNSCPVFVLLPGDASFLVGSQKLKPKGARYDAEREAGEPEVHEEPIEAFFASKYEFTNGQWDLLDGGEHRRRSEGSEMELIQPRCPLVNANVMWIQHVISAWGMRLPDAAEWEYFARAGTDTPRWCGDSVGSLQGNENLYDRSLAGREDDRGEGDAVRWNDGFPFTAPVDSLTPNAFGLHHVLGNASEVTIVDNGVDDPWVELRGSSWHLGAKAARSTARVRWDGSPLHTIGFRPVIPVQR